jgi:two-component sensor histidine kinase
MTNRQKSYLIKLARITFFGLAIGVTLGYIAIRFDWGFSYTTAILMVLGCAYGVEIFSSLSVAYLFPRLEKYSRGKKLVFQIISSALFHVIGWLLLVWIASRIIGFAFFRWEVMAWLAVFIVLLIIVSSTGQLLRFYREIKQKDAIEEKLKALATQAELKALKAQINPHFLFNSLNTIASLTTSAPAKAEEAVEKLADGFRYVLSSSDREFVTLQNEIDFLDSYLDVEKARFGDKLEVIKSVQPETLNTHIPSLILQPLVENCLKHGRSPEGNARIEIQCFLESDDVKIEIRDQGRGAPEGIKKGIYTQGTGLRNVNERLLKAYGEGYGLKIKDNNPSGAIATLIIPKEKR